MLKQVLMVAYHYPPEGSSSGVLRTLKFSKYLDHFSWHPHVLTLKKEMYTQTDPELLSDIPTNVRVHRTSVLKPRLSPAVPDRFVGWVPFGVREGLRLNRREKLDALFSTSPLPSAHLIALLLKRVLGCPWVADLRDPWIEDGAWPRPGSLRYRTDVFLERSVLGASDRITVTTEGLKDELRRRYGRLIAEKVVVIPNGFDEEDFQGIEKEHEPQDCRFVILHAGMVTPEYRDPFPLLEALAGLVRMGRVGKQAVVVRFLGGGTYPDSSEFATRVQRLGLGDCVEVRTRVSYRECLASMIKAHALLLLQDSHDTRHLIPAKAFEYLRARRPILALTTSGATAELIRNTGSGYLLEPSDPSQIQATLLALMREKQNGWRSNGTSNIDLHPYERRHLTERLASLLDSVKR